MALRDPRTDTLLEAIGAIKPRARNRSAFDMITGPNDGTDEDELARENPMNSMRPDVLMGLLSGMLTEQSVQASPTALPRASIKADAMAGADEIAQLADAEQEPQLREPKSKKPSGFANVEDPAEADTLAQDIEILRFEGIDDEAITKMLVEQLGYDEREAAEYLRSIGK